MRFLNFLLLACLLLKLNVFKISFSLGKYQQLLFLTKSSKVVILVGNNPYWKIAPPKIWTNGN